MKFLKTLKNVDGVYTVTLNREDVHNAFNAELIAEITTCFEQISHDNSIRLVVLTGAGKSFCSGADLNWMKSMKDYSELENFSDSKKLAKMFKVINDCEKPVIGKINGHALGGGVGLVSVCDYVHVKESVKFGFTEVRLGLIPAVISPFVINKIGESMARATFLSGELFSAKQALEMQLVHRISSAKDFETEFEQTLASFLKAAPEATTQSKKLISNVLNFEKTDLLYMTCKAISNRRVSKEGQEGMSALLEKRKPDWIKK